MLCDSHDVIDPLYVGPHVEILDPSTCVDRLWGSLSEWMLELKDGQWVAIPLSLIRPPCKEVEEQRELAIQPIIDEEGMGSESEVESSKRWFESWSRVEREEDDVSMV